MTTEQQGKHADSLAAYLATFSGDALDDEAQQVAAATVDSKFVTMLNSIRKDELNHVHSHCS